MRMPRLEIFSPIPLIHQDIFYVGQAGKSKRWAVDQLIKSCILPESIKIRNNFLSIIACNYIIFAYCFPVIAWTEMAVSLLSVGVGYIFKFPILYFQAKQLFALMALNTRIFIVEAQTHLHVGQPSLCKSTFS